MQSRMLEGIIAAGITLLKTKIFQNSAEMLGLLYCTIQ